MESIRRIAVLCYDRYRAQIVNGLFQYAQNRPDWMLQVGSFDQADILKGGFDAVVGTFPKESDCDQLLKKGIPLVAIFWRPPKSTIPCIKVDHEAVGRMAADYLWAQGFRHFGFVGPCKGLSTPASKAPILDTGYLAQEGRCRGFCEALKEKADTVSVAPDENIWEATPGRKLVDWLQSLPKPAGVLCLGDVIAQFMTVLCRNEGISVPSQIGILGVDNHEQVCELSRPRLSTIALPWMDLGMEAGRLLDRIFAQEELPREPVMIQPVEVIVRDSVGKPSGDALAEQALMILRARAFDGSKLETIFSDFPASRRGIERHVHAQTGKTLLDELWRIRLERARQLLSNPEAADWTLTRIAQSSGFKDSRHMKRVFEKELHQIPNKLRQRRADQ
ncbi:MAG: substrate-binding domain-containing protein [Kiritimatiellia bacterium]|nr:substrate-binding domain-containing protein [Kiritimatiellia bacterium]